MRIFINNEEFGSEDGTAVSEQLIQSFLDERKLFLTGILVNDIPVDMDLQEALSLEAVETVKIQALTASELAQNSIREALGYLPRLTEGLKTAADLFQQGSEAEAACLFIQALEGVGWVAELADLLGQIYGGFSGNLPEKLGQLLEAWENQDYVLIGDLLSYELVPELENFQRYLGEVKSIKISF